MYISHYNLKEKPFEMTFDPKFIWLGKKHKEALTLFNKAVQENKRPILLSGDVGVGKTALIHHFLRSLSNNVRVAIIPDPLLETLDFFNFLAAELKINEEFKRQHDFVIHFKKFLYAAHPKTAKLLIVIDEAQLLSLELLQVLPGLSEITLNANKLINIIFVGQSKNNRQLKEKIDKALGTKTTINYHLEPLTEIETRQFIHHRLKTAGSEREFFTPEAIKQVYFFSAGYPHSINLICDHALLTGYANGIKNIYEGVIKECANDLGLEFKQR
jgi:general secretion pathway protein A